MTRVLLDEPRLRATLGFHALPLCAFLVCHAQSARAVMMDVPVVVWMKQSGAPRSKSIQSKKNLNVMEIQRSAITSRILSLEAMCVYGCMLSSDFLSAKGFLHKLISWEESAQKAAALTRTREKKSMHAPAAKRLQRRVLNIENPGSCEKAISGLAKCISQNISLSIAENDKTFRVRNPCLYTFRDETTRRDPKSTFSSRSPPPILCVDKNRIPAARNSLCR